MKEAIAFIGLGRMGREMAGRLLAGGHPVRVFNRTRSAAEALLRQGAKAANRAVEAVQPGGVLITMIADDAAVKAVMTDEVIGALGTDGVHISMSTISPAAARDLAAAHARSGSAFLAAPVFGRPEAARAGKLWIPLAGDRRAKPRALPVLEVLGQGVFDFGEDPAAAIAVKLAGNFLIASTIEALGEALTFAEKSGVDPAKLQTFLAGTLFDSAIHKTYGKAIVEEKYEPAGFALSLGAKDVRLLREAAREVQAPLPLAALLEERFLRSLANGRGGLDWVAFTIDQREGAGLRRPAEKPSESIADRA
jgi:3-hydroxyisobutyrate dehydrogenase-like beta-hydroxyacid dehydrogenase